MRPAISGTQGQHFDYAATTSAPILSGFRVVELTDERNLLCGKLLADLGATVIRVVDTSCADATSRASVPPAEWGTRTAYNVGKHVLDLDLSTRNDRRRLQDEILTSDFFLESGKPGSLAAHGLSYDQLRTLAPHLVYVSVTPFGQSGPYSQFESSDIVLQAMGGHVAVTGERERAPLSIGVDIAYRHGGAEAAAAAMIAHFHRERTGRGQHVDVSIQQCVIWTLLNSTMTPQLLNRNDERGGALRKERGRDLLTKVVWRCKDGLVHFVPIGGGGGKARARSYRAFVEWMNSEGWDDPLLLARDWNGKDLHSVTQEEYDRLTPLFSDFLQNKTVDELYDRAVRDRLLLAPIARIPDLLASPQLRERGVFSAITVDSGDVLVPGRFAVFSETPLAPAQSARLGAPDNANGERVTVREPPLLAPQPGGGEHRASAFEGIRVADFAWAAAGPIITKCLADHGATVVRVESTTHPDSVRMGGPFKDGIPGMNRSGFFADFNTSKKSIVLDMTSEKGRAVARRLVDWADVLTESYTPGVMHRFGLSYEDLRGHRPDLVMLSTCMQGQTGPYASYAGYGGQGAAIAGLHYVTGWPDLDPAGPKGAYTDAITPRFGIAALAAALAHRDRTGRGQYIDLSQVEASLQMLAPEILEYQRTGEVAGPMGNRSDRRAPQGVFPCLGDDRWIAIAVETDEQWTKLAAVMGGGLANRADLGSTQARMEERDYIDGHVSAWTRDKDAWRVMHELQRAGVPCGVVQRPSDLFDDPQLKHRGHFWALDHPELGTLRYNGTSFSLSETPAFPRAAAPLLGEHTRAVLTDLLGYSDREVDDLGYGQILQ